VVERPDVIGAIFGQTEGLLGQDLDLRELQKNGRIGRIDVILETINGKTKGKIIIPSSLSLSETTLIAAAVETVERIGPCSSKIRVKMIKDVRVVQREYVIRRARTLLKKFLQEEMPDVVSITEKLEEAFRSNEITEYRGLPAGPEVESSEEIIVVEGRADVINLLKHGINNVIALGGTSIPKEIIDLSKEKMVTLFIDGDRGGELIAKEMLQVAEIDYIAKSPEGKEVEELTKKEVFKALRSKVPAEQFLKDMYLSEINEDVKSLIIRTLDEIVGTRAVCIFDSSLKLKKKLPLSQLGGSSVKDGFLMVVDGTVTNDIVKYAEKNKIEYVVGNEVKMNVKEMVSTPVKVLERWLVNSYKT